MVGIPIVACIRLSCLDRVAFICVPHPLAYVLQDEIHYLKSVTQATQSGIHILVSRCLATKISKAYFRLWEGCGLLESSPMMEGGHWGAIDHASHAPE